MRTKKLQFNFRNRIFAKIALVLFTYIAILLIFVISDFLPQTHNIKEGDITQEDITVKVNGTYEDPLETEHQKDIAEKNAGVVYYIDPLVAPTVRTRINNIFSKIRDAQQNEDLERLEDKINWLKVQLDSIIDHKPPYYILATLVSSDEKELELLENTTHLIIRSVMAWHINQSQMPGALKMIEQKSFELPFSEEYSKAVEEIAKSVILPNSLIDVEETQKLKEQARENVEPVLVSVKAGEVIIPRGHSIEAYHIDILTQLGMMEKGLNIREIFGIILLLFVIFSILAFYIYKREDEDFYSTKNLVFFSIILISHLVLTRILQGVNGYLNCLPAAAMFLAILYDYRISIVCAVAMAMIFSLFPGNEISFVLVALIGSIIGAFSVLKINKRLDLLIAGCVVGVTNFISILAFSLINYNNFWLMIKDSFLYGFLGGILLSAFLVLPLLPIFEKYFDFVPQIRLLELSNQQEPLLQKLLMEAPGTFQHSLIVANLAEKVASELGANALLTRVGALYHDIGKMKRPTFFVENQAGENPHDKITPTLSSLIIHSHVKDGLELAKKYKLPKAIQDFIPQHQGTGLVTYFYHKAKQGEYGDSVDEKDFRYPGPKPQSKETAILMVSDCVEAASRTLEKPTPARIQGLVEKIIDKCLEDGQFDECDLSFKDLSIMTEVLTQTVTTMYHKRIEYPEEAKKKLTTKTAEFSTRKLELKEGKSQEGV